MDKVISFRIDEETYNKITKVKDSTDIETMSEFMRGFVSVIFDGKFIEIVKEDLPWIKYVYVLGMGVKYLMEKFETIRSDSPEAITYMQIMTTSISNMVDSISNTDNYLIPFELESNYIDAINLFYTWLDRNNIDEYHVKKLSDKLKQQLKEK